MSTRNSKFPFIVSALSAAIMVSACGGDGSLGGGDTAGIGGSGFISSGSVTGFGSVFVNGVEFETDSAIFEIEDASLSQSDLRVGMVVQVEGTINPDGISGTATGIQYSDDIEGPISAITGESTIIENADATEKTFSIMGKTVIVSSTDTAFEGTGFTYDSIVLDNVIEVSGFEDQNGALRASYVERKSMTFDPVSILEVKGIAVWTGSNFTVQGINIDVTSTIYIDLANGLQDGLLVEVKGIYDSGANTIAATEIDAESNDLSEDASEVEIEGIITVFNGLNDFEINGFKVDASNITSTPQLQVGDKIEVEGTINRNNGVLIAMEIEARGGNAEVSATVATIPASLNDSFTVNVAGQTVTVQLTPATRMEDDFGEDDFLDITMPKRELALGDFINVRGYENDTNTIITATQLKRESEVKDTELQGVITAQHEDATITVLGVDFPVNANTEYKAADESQIGDGSHFDFISATSSGVVVVKIEDKKVFDRNDVGIADSVEIED